MTPCCASERPSGAETDCSNGDDKECATRRYGPSGEAEFYLSGVLDYENTNESGAAAENDPTKLPDQVIQFEFPSFLLAATPLPAIMPRSAQARSTRW